MDSLDLGIPDPRKLSLRYSVPQKDNTGGCYMVGPLENPDRILRIK